MGINLQASKFAMCSQEQLNSGTHNLFLELEEMRPQPRIGKSPCDARPSLRPR
jgi:hypothetical protein